MTAQQTTLPSLTTAPGLANDGGYFAMLTQI